MYNVKMKDSVTLCVLKPDAYEELPLPLHLTAPHSEDTRRAEYFVTLKSHHIHPL